MKFLNWLPFTVALGIATGASAQPPGYGPGIGPYGGRPGTMPMRPTMPGAATRMQAPTRSSAPAADSAQSGQPARAQSPLAQASETLAAGIDKLIGFLGQKELPNKLQMAAYLDREIAPYFDFDHMARWVAARSWEGMSEDERHAMAARLEASFLSALSGHLADYKGQQARILRARPGTRGTVNVPVAIVRPGGYPARMEFRMYRSADGWKVYDVLANGRSVTAFYRVRYQRMGAKAEAGQGKAAAGN